MGFCQQRLIWYDFLPERFGYLALRQGRLRDCGKIVKWYSFMRTEKSGRATGWNLYCTTGQKYYEIIRIKTVKTSLCSFLLRVSLHPRCKLIPQVSFLNCGLRCNTSTVSRLR